MNIGLYFGSFNPIHNGHLIIAQFILNNDYSEKIWFVISPQNPFKINDPLLDVQNRFLLIKKAIKGNKQFKVSDIELNLPTPSYTINTLEQLRISYPQHIFSLILGSDNFLIISQWKSSDIILSKYQILVYERPGFLIKNKNLASNIIIMQSPLINISSTEIRNMIKLKQSVRYLVPEAVLSVINKNNFYS